MDPETRTEARRWSPADAALLREHRKAQLAARMRAGGRWQDQDLIFCQDDGSPWRPSMPRECQPSAEATVSNQPQHCRPSAEGQMSSVSRSNTNDGCAARDLNPEPAD